MKTNHTLRSSLTELPISLIALLLLCTPMLVKAQSAHIEWQRTYRALTHPTDASLAGLGEDWMYDIEKNIDPTSHNLLGYYLAGYSSTVNANPLDETPDKDDLEDDTHLKGGFYHKVAKTDLTGNMIWYKVLNTGGFLQAVSETDDGGIIATGFVFENYSTIPSGLNYSVKYNPNSTYPTGQTIAYPSGTGYRDKAAKIFVVKLDKDGGVQWNYCYGIDDDPADATGKYGKANDIILTGHNTYIVVGEEGASKSDNASKHLFLMEIDLDGKVLHKNISAPNIIGYAIARNSDFYVIAGEQLNPTETYDKSDAYLASFDYSDLAASGTWEARLNNYNVIHGVSNLSDCARDVDFSSDGNVLLPIMENCYVGQAEDDHGIGEGYVRKYTASTLAVVSGWTYTIGEIRAYDLKIGITPTSDGGSAVVTTKAGSSYTTGVAVALPDGSSYTVALEDTRYWRTSGFVAKLNSSGVEQWHKNFDSPFQAADPYNYWPNDVRKEECLYKIVESASGEYVVCGNNSLNFDDDYMVKLKEDCGTIYTTKSTQTITDHKTWGNEFVSGTITIASGGWLTIANATVTFADTRAYTDKYPHVDASTTFHPTTIIVEPGGKLEISNSTLKAGANCGKMWDGIQVLGDPTKLQSVTTNQGYLAISNSTIQDARYGIICGKLIYDNPTQDSLPLYDFDATKYGGGIVQANKATFSNCYYSYVAASYKLLPIYNVFKLCTFTNNATMADPDFLSIGNRKLGMKSFAWLNGARMTTFEGCSMNGYGALDEQYRGTGVLGYYSGLRIIKHNDMGTYTYASLSNLYKGTDLYSLGSVADKLQISDATFTDVAQGITATGHTFATIRNNTMDWSGLSPALIPHYGIFQYGGTGWGIQNNTMTGNSGYDWGILVHNSGDLQTDITNNTITSAELSLQMEDYNYHVNTKCNGLYQMSYGMVASPRGIGVLNPQGTGCGSSAKRPMNKFDGSCANQIEVGSGISFDYYENPNNTDAAISTAVTDPGFNICSALTGADASGNCDDPTPALWYYASYSEVVSHGLGLAIPSDIGREKLAADKDSEVVYDLSQIHFGGAKKILAATAYSLRDSVHSIISTDSIDASYNDDQNFKDFMHLLIYNSTHEFSVNDSVINLLNKGYSSDAEMSYLYRIPSLAHFAKSADWQPEIIKKSGERRASPSVPAQQTTQELLDIYTYPNPVNDEVTITVPPTGETYTIQLFSLVGQLMRTCDTTKDAATINCSDIASGIYVLKISDKSGQLHQTKLTVSH